MNYNKFNFRSNIDINITKSTELGLSLSTQYTTTNQPNSSLADLYNYTMLSTPISTAPIYSDGTLAIASDNGSTNPYNMLNNSGYARTANVVAQSLMSLTQDFSDIITPGLKANVKFSWDAQNSTTLNRAYSPNVYSATGRDEDGNLIFDQTVVGTGYMSLARSNAGWTTINFEGSLTYERLFADDHRVSALFLYSVRNRTNNVPGTYIAAFPYRNMGIAARVTYAFRDKYFLEFNCGYNGSENFAPGKRYGFFPAYALGYMISNEKFWGAAARQDQCTEDQRFLWQNR